MYLFTPHRSARILATALGCSVHLDRRVLRDIPRRSTHQPSSTFHFLVLSSLISWLFAAIYDILAPTARCYHYHVVSIGDPGVRSGGGTANGGASQHAILLLRRRLLPKNPQDDEYYHDRSSRRRVQVGCGHLSGKD